MAQQNSYTLLQKSTFTKRINGEDITYWDMLNKTFIIPDDFAYSVYVVERDYIARPDLIALAVYGDDQAADFICKLNGISNPFDLNEGMVLIIPAITDLPSFLYTSSDGRNEFIEEVTGESKEVTSGAKSITDKTRQPNTAIINQPNFTIDKKKRTIRY